MSMPGKDEGVLRLPELRGGGIYQAAGLTDA